ncbi:hypothetical protein OIU79_011796 [Salix purpurea]|uniref:Uncharacterized protein n=1 Tax=Salix purpurea TaxID=77065 RepID=A0A9Q0Q1M1_SALPP|nr:hypothetical protein OIU79_011796 [Salix purpurea]
MPLQDVILVLQYCSLRYFLLLLCSL